METRKRSQRKGKVLFVVYSAVITVLVCAIIAVIFFGMQKKLAKGTEMGVLKDGIYYYSSHESQYLWTEDDGAVQIKHPERVKSVSLDQGTVYLNDRGDAAGNLYFRAESKADGGSAEKEILLENDTGMKYLIYDKDGESDLLIGWAPEYRGRKIGTTTIWRLEYSEDESEVTGVQLVDRLQ